MNPSAPALPKNNRVTRCVICGKQTSERCAICKSVYYCSATCQQLDWEWHASEECNDVPLPPLEQSENRQFIASSIAFIEGPANLDADEEAARQERLGANVLRLYHQTNAAAADSIVASQEFRLGSVGYAGAGIYFAVTPEDTDLKAHEKGVILVATVKLGEVMNLTRSDRTIDGNALHASGYDSVYLRRPTGPEYVVYFSDQVTDVSRYERGGGPGGGRPSRKRAPLKQIEDTDDRNQKVNTSARRAAPIRKK